MAGRPARPTAHRVQAVFAGVQVFGLAPQYLAELCVPVAEGVTNYRIGPPWYIMRHLGTCHNNKNTSKEASELSRLPITAPPS